MKWNKVSAAKGYYIYRKDSKNGTYKKIKTIENCKTTSFKDTKNLKANKTYYYKVVSFNTQNGVTAAGNASNIKSVKR